MSAKPYLELYVTTKRLAGRIQDALLDEYEFKSMVFFDSANKHVSKVMEIAHDLAYDLNDRDQYYLLHEFHSNLESLRIYLEILSGNEPTKYHGAYVHLKSVRDCVKNKKDSLGIVIDKENRSLKDTSTEQIPNLEMDID